MEKKKIIDLIKVAMLIQILAWPIFAYSQNLVLNNDFEELVMEIGTYTLNGVFIHGEPDTSKVWRLHDKDHICVKAKYYQPVVGSEQSGCYSNIGYARSGRIYGLIEYYSFLGTRHEAYQIANTEGRFCKPLLKGKTYTFCFWIKPFMGNITADSVQIDFHGLGDYEDNVHRQQVAYKKSKRFVKKYNQSAQKRKFISMALPNDKEKYSQICIGYTAKGGELGFKVGNLDMHLPYFQKFEDLEHFGHDYERIKNYKYPFVSYIIDDISMVSNTDNTDFCLTPMLNKYRYSNDIRLRSVVRSESKKSLLIAIFCLSLIHQGLIQHPMGLKT